MFGPWRIKARGAVALGVLAAAACVADAQWEIQHSTTTADLRGIASVGGGVAWASGTNGTVVRTEDGGFEWQGCSMPPGAEHLDFRGVQAFDANTAMVMSSGKGELSRLYRTTDGCHSWTLLFTNPDADGFWDALQFDGRENGIILGDPVGGSFAVFVTRDGGQHWTREKLPGTDAEPSRESAFAASNSSLVLSAGLTLRSFVTGGAGGALVFACHGEQHAGGDPASAGCTAKKLPLGQMTESSGAFSLGYHRGEFVAAGGDYQKPDERAGTAAYSQDGGKSWHAAQTPPHGYRSAVAYDEKSRTWITVGTNGTDVSTDGGRNWQPLKPNPALGEPADADRNWNALALPFVVGPHGRIGKLRESATAPGPKKRD